jgi:hypothetical protein
MQPDFGRYLQHNVPGTRGLAAVLQHSCGQRGRLGV